MTAGDTHKRTRASCVVRLERVQAPYAWVLLGIAVLYLTSMRSVWGAAIALACVLAPAFGPRARGAPALSRQTCWVAVSFMALGALAQLRPLTPLAWDEFVWVSKAQIEARGGFGALTAAALEPGHEVFPAGYPLLWSLLPGWLSPSPQLLPLTVAFGIGKWLCFGAFGLTLAASGLWQPHPRTRWTVLACGALGLAFAAPLFLVHARLVYADAPVGLLAAALALSLLARGQEGSRLPFFVPAALAIVLCGFKDEGTGHVVAVTCAAWMFGPRGLRGPALSALGASLATFATWRVALAQRGLSNADHSLGHFTPSAAFPLARTFIAEALDPLSWGLLWPLTAAAAALLLVVPHFGSPDPANLQRRQARFLAAAWCLQVGVLLGALLVGPERVRLFAWNGTLLNRLLVQVTPTAALVLVSFVNLYRLQHEAAGQKASPSSPSSSPTSR